MADTATDVAAQVAANIARVGAARDRALASLELSYFGFMPTYSSGASAIRGLDPVKAAWEKRGKDALAAGKPPGANGWSGWVQGGRDLIDGYVREAGDAGKEALKDIVSVAASAPATSAKAVVTAAKKTAAVAVQVADSVGTAATVVGSTLKWVGIGAVLLVGGLVALKYGPRRT